MQTPYYLVEEEKLRRNLALIKDVADRSGAEIILAFKAFALWKTFSIFREYISHTTASSPDEARLAFEEFGSPAHTYSPAYTEHDFPEILRCSSHITFNSLSQFHRFADPPLTLPCREGVVTCQDEKDLSKSPSQGRLAGAETADGNNADACSEHSSPSLIGRAGGGSAPSFASKVFISIAIVRVVPTLSRARSYIL